MTKVMLGVLRKITEEGLDMVLLRIRVLMDLCLVHGSVQELTLKAKSSCIRLEDGAVVVT